jgi:hypothetical protein
MLTEKGQNGSTTYSCLSCHYTTGNKSKYERHLSTRKHLFNKNLTEKGLNGTFDKPTFSCVNCNKIYKSRVGLWQHSKQCIPEKEHDELPKTNSLNTNIVMELIKQNKELQELLIKQAADHNKNQSEIINKLAEREHTSNISNNNNIHTTNNNQKLNLNVFLNETCKNALNFTEFIDNIQVTYGDLENNAKLGFVDGMTKVIVDHLKQLALSDRPIHCTDVKRETIYVKEEDQWEKEKSKETIQKGIQEITCKGMQKLSEWREDNPEYNDMETETGEKSIAFQQNSMAGGKRDEFYPKIIKNIAKETILDKKRLLE